MPLIQDDPRDLAPSENQPSQLVCGCCEELLPGTLEGLGEADETADDHAEREHPDRDVVVVPVAQKLAEAQPAAVIEIASIAQAQATG